MSANDFQVGGNHYVTHGGLQHWDVVHKFNLDYFQGQITKYVMRWKDKGGVEDLKKARHFLDKYIELNKPEKDPETLHTKILATGRFSAEDARIDPSRNYVDQARD